MQTRRELNCSPLHRNAQQVSQIVYFHANNHQLMSVPCTWSTYFDNHFHDKTKYTISIYPIEQRAKTWWAHAYMTTSRECVQVSHYPWYHSWGQQTLYTDRQGAAPLTEWLWTWAGVVAAATVHVTVHNHTHVLGNISFHLSTSRQYSVVPNFNNDLL